MPIAHDFEGWRNGVSKRITASQELYSMGMRSPTSIGTNSDPGLSF